MKVKICGITDVKTAIHAMASGADALGFVFAESKRKISITQAQDIISQLPDGILKVGVFVNEDPEVIQRTVEETGINVIQLHGDEMPEFCAQFSVPVVKAFSIGTKEDLKQIETFSCEYVLLDSPKGKYRGGNGVAFDWTLIKDTHLSGKKVILAGGLSPQNITQAIQTAKPYMVDVSSGVETDGQKDLGKITEFIELAKKKEEEVV